jgi:hypothetical protein
MVGIPGVDYHFGHPCCDAKYPPVSEIEARCFEPLDNEKEFRNAFPYANHLRLRPNQKITATRLQAAIDHAKAEVERDIERYEDIRKRGNKAMSKYDLSMNYTAQNSGLPLTYAHIGYNRGRLRILEHWQKKLFPHNIDSKRGVQKELF